MSFCTYVANRLHKFRSLPYDFYSIPVHKTYTKPDTWKNKTMQMTREELWEDAHHAY